MTNNMIEGDKGWLLIMMTAIVDEGAALFSV